MKRLLLAAALLSIPMFAWATTTTPTKCLDPALEEHTITDALAAEPTRPHLIIVGQYLDVFKWNMKWAFNVDVDADTIYVVQARTVGEPKNADSWKYVHLYTVRDHCITHYQPTWGRVVAAMIDPHTWETEHPNIPGDPANNDPMPDGRPPMPTEPAPQIIPRPSQAE